MQQVDPKKVAVIIDRPKFFAPNINIAAKYLQIVGHI
tara:strand:+ start:274 stop:384 length:111 start_codon:yes stop_codon:yes gene_type:complete